MQEGSLNKGTAARNSSKLGEEYIIPYSTDRETERINGT